MGVFSFSFPGPCQSPAWISVPVYDSVLCRLYITGDHGCFCVWLMQWLLFSPPLIKAKFLEVHERTYNCMPKNCMPKLVSKELLTT